LSVWVEKGRAAGVVRVVSGSFDYALRASLRMTALIFNARDHGSNFHARDDDANFCAQDDGSSFLRGMTARIFARGDDGNLFDRDETRAEKQIPFSTPSGKLAGDPGFGDDRKKSNGKGFAHLNARHPTLSSFGSRGWGTQF
jgi:hypothetical protein